MVEKQLQWHIMGASVCGASHVRHHLPNQDAIKWHSELSSTAILAISDGHGSQKCFRSDRGANFAVNVTIDILKPFFENQTDKLTLIKLLINKQLPQEIVEQWWAAVESDLNKYPFSDQELEILNGRDNTLAYGATLLTVVATPRFIIYLQLGDGDILTIWKNGSVERALPKDERLFGNETTSLCAKNAWQDFRCRFQPLVDAAPSMILLATDGYANSFPNDENFLQVGTDIGQMIESEGPSFVRGNLKSWLHETSENGSGDDITVGIICST